MDKSADGRTGQRSFEKITSRAECTGMMCFFLWSYTVPTGTDNAGKREEVVVLGGKHDGIFNTVV
jgi:hypothetical protein